MWSAGSTSPQFCVRLDNCHGIFEKWFLNYGFETTLDGFKAP